MVNNRQLTITSANTRMAVHWARTNIQLYEFVQKLSNPQRSAETYETYIGATKRQQDEWKDVGGFVGGVFRSTRRKAADLVSRCLITLDMDAIPEGMADEVIRRVDALGCFTIVYSTRKHAPWMPRLRVVVVLDTDCTPDEYEPIARKLAEMIAIDWCDPTTFEASRLMYWPSVCADGEYKFWWCDKPFLSKDGMLSLYRDWHNVNKWPTVPGHDDIQRKKVEKAGDPTQKGGVVGAFCSTYSITDALATFIPDVYTATETPGRYTYTGASTYGGAVVYDDKFLYSHHASDPICNQLVNAFDLVRLHKYGDLDDDVKAGTPVSSLPSYKAMRDFAMDVPTVKSAVLTAKQAAADVFDVADSNSAAVVSTEWYNNLRMNGEKTEKSRDNLLLIMDNDENLKGKIITDVFSSRGLVRDKLPWDRNWKENDPDRRWDDADDAGARWYLELFYGIEAPTKITDALLLTGKNNQTNVVHDYLKSITWDGIPRIDTMLTDYLGVVDNVYTRAVMSKTMIAAVARAIVGGVKFDYVPIIHGRQGVGKTMLVSRLGKDWYTASLTSFGDKASEEQIQGVWIVELGELAALTKQMVESVKNFISKTSDEFRVPYGRHVMSFPRRCVFIGTTNSKEVLKDPTGNRRFLPVTCDEVPRTKDVFHIPEREIDQMWAEAYFRWQIGESLLMPTEANGIALSMQEQFEVENPLLGQIQEHLKKPIVKGWRKLDWPDRVSLLQRDAGNILVSEYADADFIPRDKVCPKEIWYEMMHGGSKEPDTPTLNRIKDALSKAEGWEPIGKPEHFGRLGTQRFGYKRKGEDV